MIKLLLSLLLICFIQPVSAQEISIVPHGFSKHANSSRSYNENNWGVGVRFNYKDFAIQAGNYKNSIRGNSSYLLVDWNLVEYETISCIKLEGGPFIGAATGYSQPVTPIGGLQAAVKCKNFFVRFRVVPDLYYNARAVGTLELGYTFFRF